jgi:hypothetical protein
VLGVIGVFVAGWLIGGFTSLQSSFETSAENRALRERVTLQAREIEQLRQWQADNRTRLEIDEAALELVRLELAAQQETIAELEKGMRFYKSLMAPEEITEGLSVRSIDLKPGLDERRFQFRILVQQSARKHSLLTGTLNIELIGTVNGEEVEYNLTDLSEQVPGAGIRLRFKYFQAIEGELELPAGFTPQMMRASAQSTKPRRAEFTRDFAWSVQEKLSHVGQ